ncbi:HAD family phosphatase [Synechococcus sp. GFB01]|uniref:HAD family hydrolase n=1 Tax=Synechococcus sp. GFB01 TaxID=1662190 RepID=UPI000B33D898|nr:HAD family hydrolase [Synechococcus sp. GFB01]
MIVTTSGRPAVEALMGRLLGGLADAFGFWVCGEDVRRKKPDPEAYLQALERLGRRPDQVICLEDSPAGLAAATAAGLPCLVSLSHYASREDPESFRAARAVVSRTWPPLQRGARPGLSARADHALLSGTPALIP